MSWIQTYRATLLPLEAGDFRILVRDRCPVKLITISEPHIRVFALDCASAFSERARVAGASISPQLSAGL